MSHFILMLGGRVSESNDTVVVLKLLCSRDICFYKTYGNNSCIKLEQHNVMMCKSFKCNNKLKQVVR